MRNTYNVSLSYEHIENTYLLLTLIAKNIDTNSGRITNPELSVMDLAEIIELRNTLLGVLNANVYPKRDAIFIKYCTKDSNGDPILTNGEFSFPDEAAVNLANDDVKSNLVPLKAEVIFKQIRQDVWHKIKNISGDAVELLIPFIV